MNRPTRAHWLRHNQVTRIPRAFIYFDSEASQRAVQGSKVQTFRLAVAAMDRRAHHADAWREREWGTFTSPSDLWTWVDARCQVKARTIMVAHNVGYDLRITDALRELTKRGWRLQGIRLDATQAWCSWKHEGRTLVVCDSHSWLALPLQRIGRLLELPKLDLPPWDDTEEAWTARCHRDVEIVADAYRRILEWVRRDDLGNWRPTGAGQSWSAFRHRFMDHDILCHEDEEARAAEREAAWTGRCEAWRWGKLRGGPFYEWDYSTAYARIGAECEVPTRLLGRIARPELDRLRALPSHRTYVAECRVSTDVPTVPTRHGERIVWPVGEFTTTLWGTEVELALAHGAELDLTRAWWYETTPALRRFCQWCLGMLGDELGDVDPIVKAAIKHWSRALIGRFGARWSEWELVGEAGESDVSLGWWGNGDTGERWRMLHVGTQLRREGERHDCADSVPSVMSWVTAECRRRIYEAAELAGIAQVAYLDTDSLIVDRAGHQALQAASIPGLRVKAEHGTLEVLGPRQIITGGELRASGVPRTAVRVDRERWEAEVWSGLASSIESGEPSSVRITPRMVRLRGTDHRREHLSGGRTAPILVGMTEALAS